MKKTFYSLIAILGASVGTFATSSNSHSRFNNYFKYIGPTSPSAPSYAVTSLSNWTLTYVNPGFDCLGNDIACGIETDAANLQTWGFFRHIPKKVYNIGKRAATGGITSGTIVYAAYNQDYK